MALESFVPTIWSARLIRSLKNQLVYGQPNVINTDYQGDFAQAGDTVRVGSIGRVSVSNYVRNTDIAAPEELDDAHAVVLIDQQKYFHFQIDDVDRAQANVEVIDAAMGEAAYSLQEVADSYIAAKMVAGVPSYNTLGAQGTPKTFSNPEDAYDLLVDMGVALAEAKVPRMDRWAIIPPWFTGLLLKDERFTHATAMGDATLLNGQIGAAAGFSLIEANTVPVDTGIFKILFGTRQATTFAQQVSKVEAYRPERRFADAVKGLHVYGAKVIRPEFLGMVFADQP